MTRSSAPLPSPDPARQLQTIVAALEPTEKNLRNPKEYSETLSSRINFYEKDCHVIEKRIQKLREDKKENTHEFKQLQNDHAKTLLQINVIKKLQTSLDRATDVKEEKQRNREIALSLKMACLNGFIEMQRYYAMDFIRNIGNIADQRPHLLNNEQPITRLNFYSNTKFDFFPEEYILDDMAFFMPSAIDYFPQLTVALRHNTTVTAIDLDILSENHIALAILQAIKPALGASDQLKQLQNILVRGDDEASSDDEASPSQSFSPILSLATALKDRHLSTLELRNYKEDKNDKDSFLNNLQGKGTVATLRLREGHIEDSSALGRLITHSQVRKIETVDTVVSYSLDFAIALNGITHLDGAIVIRSDAKPDEEYKNGETQGIQVHANCETLVAAMLATNSSLVYLKLCESRLLSAVVIDVFSRIFPHMLTSLCLPENQLPKYAIQLLANILEKNTCALTELDIQSNNIDDEGAVVLSRSLEHNSTLRILDTSGNIYSIIGAGALMMSSYHNALAILGLSSKRCYSAAIKGLLDRLQHRDLSVGFDCYRSREILKQHLEQERCIVNLRQSWMKAAVTIAFIRASQTNTLRESIITLLPTLIDLSGLAKKRVQPGINPSQFIGTLFFRRHMLQQPSNEVAIQQSDETKYGMKRKR